MDAYEYDAKINQAEIAFVNGQYETALKWYRAALEERPDDLAALSRAGAVCAALDRFDDAMGYFSRAVELDRENGDHYFNLGNAWFFQEQYKKAFDCYVDAERLGCSEDVTARLYYQMALLCSLRQDIKSALFYMAKCEDSDSGGTISMSPDLLSEKTKLYMALGDYDNAERSAAQLVASNPGEFRNYMVYLALLMAQRKFSAAQNLLKDAEKAAHSGEDRITLAIQWAAVYTTLAEAEPKLAESHLNKAAAVLESVRGQADLSRDQRNEILAALAETRMKARQFDAAVDCLYAVLRLEAAAARPDAAQAEASDDLTADGGPSADEIDDMLFADMDEIEDRIASGELDPDLGDEDRGMVQIEEDADGYPVYHYQLETPNEAENAEADSPEGSGGERISREKPEKIPASLRDRLYFLMTSCRVEMDDFARAEKYAAMLKHSDNQYYAYYGRYAEALSARKLAEESHNAEKTVSAERKNAEALAWFRRQSFQNPRDVLASVFRARLYAESGKYEKAKDVANLLSPNDSASILRYIEECRRSSQPAQNMRVT